MWRVRQDGKKTRDASGLWEDICAAPAACPCRAVPCNAVQCNDGLASSGFSLVFSRLHRHSAVELGGSSRVDPSLGPGDGRQSGGRA